MYDIPDVYCTSGKLAPCEILGGGNRFTCTQEGPKPTGITEFMLAPDNAHLTTSVHPALG